MTSRSTSATTTLSMIWSRPRTTMALTILPSRDILAAGAEQAAGDILGLLRLLRARHAAGQDDAVADALDA